MLGIEQLSTFVDGMFVYVDFVGCFGGWDWDFFGEILLASMSNFVVFVYWKLRAKFAEQNWVGAVFITVFDLSV